MFKYLFFILLLCRTVVLQGDDTQDNYVKINTSWLHVEIGIIGTASNDILNGAMEQVRKDGLAGLVIELDTPGGALESTRSMVKSMLSAPFPVVVWVGPGGAHAGSAGAFITLAAHVASMAPGTNIGAAHPVKASGQEMEEGEVSRKIENDTIAFMESIATLRNRNKDMAVSFVENSLSISAEQALENKVIDLIEPSLPSLFKSLNGRSVTLSDKSQVKLSTLDVSIIRFEKNTRQLFLEILSNPNIFYLLFVAGLIGIGFELSNPGAMVPGVIGGICMLTALIATSVLPVSFGALLLILASIAFMVAEIFVPSFGILGIGGFVAFVIGSVLLVDSGNDYGLRISWYSIVPGVLAVAGFGVFVAYLVLRTERSNLQSGVETMIGHSAEATMDFVDGKGQVRVDGELWTATSVDGEIKENDLLEVVEIDGLKMSVKLKV